MFYKADYVGNPIDWKSEDKEYKAWLSWFHKLFQSLTGFNTKKYNQNIEAGTDIGYLQLYFGGHHLEQKEAVLIYQAIFIMEDDTYVDKFDEIEKKFETLGNSRSSVDSIYILDSGEIYFKISTSLPIKRYNYNSENDMKDCIEAALEWFNTTSEKAEKILAPYGFVDFRHA